MIFFQDVGDCLVKLATALESTLEVGAVESSTLQGVVDKTRKIGAGILVFFSKGEIDFDLISGGCWAI